MLSMKQPSMLISLMRASCFPEEPCHTTSNDTVTGSCSNNWVKLGLLPVHFNFTRDPGCVRSFKRFHCDWSIKRHVSLIELRLNHRSVAVRTDAMSENHVRMFRQVILNALPVILLAAHLFAVGTDR